MKIKSVKVLFFLQEALTQFQLWLISSRLIQFQSWKQRSYPFLLPRDYCSIQEGNEFSLGTEKAEYFLDQSSFSYRNFKVK
jgi:hypothetical protein